MTFERFFLYARGGWLRVTSANSQHSNFVRFSAISRTNYQPLTNKFSRDFCSEIVFQHPRLIATVKVPHHIRLSPCDGLATLRSCEGPKNWAVSRIFPPARPTAQLCKIRNPMLALRLRGTGQCRNWKRALVGEAKRAVYRIRRSHLKPLQQRLSLRVIYKGLTRIF